MTGRIGWTADELVLTRRTDALRYRFRWSAIARIAAVHPWPTLWVGFRADPAEPFAGATEHRFKPHRRLRCRSAEDIATCESWAGEVAALMDATDLPPGVARDRGWLDLPEVPWERADGLPDEERAAGAYRSGGLGREVVARRVLERRPRASALLALRGWLTRSGPASEGETLRQVVVTADRVAVEMWDRTVWRLPLEALAARVEEGGDRVYVFGRRTFLVLSAADGCPVLEALDARIGAGARSTARRR